MKMQLPDPLSATPSKRLYQSIIADYNVEKAICELVDNAIDIWTMNKKTKHISIYIDIDVDQQKIIVRDNAGGVRKDQLSLIIAPGQSSNKKDDTTIGIFGVGSKRAVIFLAQEITIITRYLDEETYQVDIDYSWLNNDDWNLPYYLIDNIDEGSTIINLSNLRFTINSEDISALKDHLESTYARFLKDQSLDIILNNEKCVSKTFNNWAFPPGFPPQRYHGSIEFDDADPIEIEIIGGLTLESNYTSGDYGIFIYCNDRLIARGLKTYEVGFGSGIVGKIHRDISTMRVIISLVGNPQQMPWNSSKSGINPRHKVFLSFQKQLMEIAAHYASLSRRTAREWDRSVFKYSQGTVKDIDLDIIHDLDSQITRKKLYLPPLPISKPHYGHKITAMNRSIGEDMPWTIGLYESMIAVDHIMRQNLSNRNRICLILLDSTLEIAIKEYLVHHCEGYISDKRIKEIFLKRNKVEDELKEHIEIDEKVWRKIKHYYDLRCKLIHERATINITDSEIKDFRRIVELILSLLFHLNFDI